MNSPCTIKTTSNIYEHFWLIEICNDFLFLPSLIRLFKYSILTICFDFGIQNFKQDWIHLWYFVIFHESRNEFFLYSNNNTWKVIERERREERRRREEKKKRLFKSSIFCWEHTRQMNVFDLMKERIYLMLVARGYSMKKKNTERKAFYSF